MTKKALLACGILSSLLYVVSDIVAAMQYPGYSYTSQMVSELSAVGAPTRSAWVVMGVVYCLLAGAFGIGVRKAAGEKRSLRVAGIILVVGAVVGFAWPFFPMLPRGSAQLSGGLPTSATDVGHIVLAIATVLSVVLSIGFGSGASGKGFRLYSILTILALVVAGALTGQQTPQIAAGLPTPGLGIVERVNVYGMMLWILVLAVMLLRARMSEGAARSAAAPALAQPAASVTWERQAS